MDDKMQHNEISLDAKVDMIHVKIDYLMQIFPHALGLITDVSSGKVTRTKWEKHTDAMKDLADELNKEMGKIVEREVNG